ncbi:MAG: Hsp20 family protein [Pseudomonadota bacterium]
MRPIDFTPLYRQTVGFDRLVSMLDGFSATDTAQTYPPYNIERTGENDYSITMAVAGFAEGDLNISAKQGTLTVTGKRADQTDKNVEVLHRGIANRAFERRFQLADYVEVYGARLENGLLTVKLHRELPETMKPRTIAICVANDDDAPQIEATANAEKAAG